MQSLHYFRCIESCGTGIKTRAIHFCQLRLLQKPRFLISGVLGRHRQIPRFVKKVQAADCSRMPQWLDYFAPLRGVRDSAAKHCIKKYNYQMSFERLTSSDVLFFLEPQHSVIF